MFDNRLCRVFHKGEITVKDVAEATLTCIAIVGICALWAMCFGVMTVDVVHGVLGLTLLPNITCSTVLLKYSALGFVVFEVGYLCTHACVYVVKTIGRIKVAEYPLKKEEEKK